MQNRRRLALAGIGALALGVSVYQVAFSDRVVKSVIHDVLAVSLGAPCRIEDLHFSFENGLEVSGLEVLDPTDPTARSLVQVERAALDFRLGLFGHGLRIDSIELVGAHVHLTRRRDGSLPIMGVQLPDRRADPRPDTGPGPPPPDIRIKSGRITYHDAEFLAEGRTITVENITGSLTRDPPGLPSFAQQPHLVSITGDADVLGSVSIEGRLAPFQDPHAFDVRLDRIDLSDDLSAWLAPKYAAALAELAPRGELAFSLHAEGRTVDDTSVEARLDLTEVGCSITLPHAPTAGDAGTPARRPVDLDGLTGRVVVTGDTARLEGLRGRVLGAELSLAGTAEGVRTRPSRLDVDVEATLTGLHVGPHLAPFVPPAVLDVIEAYGLDVRTDGRVTLTGPTDDLVVRAHADVTSGRASYRGYVWKDLGFRRGFPWTVEIDRGTVDFDQERDGLLEILAQGRHGPSHVTVEGTVTHPPGGISRADVRIRADEVELGPDLRAGFEDRAERMFDRWGPSGIAPRIDVRVFNDPEIDGISTQTDVVITLDGRATFVPAELPTPLRVTRGRVHVLRPLVDGRRTDLVRLEDIAAEGERFAIGRLAGAVTGSGPETREELRIEGTTDSVETALRGALAESSILGAAVKDALARIRPSGGLAFEVDLRRSAAGVRTDRVHVELLESSIEGFADVPLAADRLRGDVVVTADRIALERVSGRVLGALVRVDGALEGPGSAPRLDITATDLPLDGDLRAALGPLDARAAPFFEVLAPQDGTRADVELHLRPPGDAEEELRLAVRRLRGPVRPLGLELTLDDGAIDYQQGRVTAQAGGRLVDAPFRVADLHVDLATEEVTTTVAVEDLRFPEDLAGLLSEDAVATIADFAPGRRLASPGLALTWSPGPRRLRLSGPLALARAETIPGGDPGLDLTGGLELDDLGLVFGEDAGFTFRGGLRASDVAITPGIEITDFEGGVVLEGRTGEDGTRLRLDAPDTRFRALDRQAEAASFVLTFDDGVTRVDDLAARVHEGTLTGRVVAGAPQFRYRGHLKLVDASAEQFFGVGPEKEMGGRLDLDVAFRNEDGARRSLRGEGEVRIVDANLAEIPLITAFSGPFEVGAFRQSEAKFALEGNRLLLSEAQLEGNLLALRGGSGSVNLAGEQPIDLTATVHAGPSGVGPLEILWKALGNTFFRVRVTGTLRNPRPQGQFFGFLDDLFGSSDVRAAGPRPVEPPPPERRDPW